MAEDVGGKERVQEAPKKEPKKAPKKAVQEGGVPVYPCPWGCDTFADGNALRGHILGAHMQGAAAGGGEAGGGTPVKGELAVIADERAMLEQYVLECWPSPIAAKKAQGVLRYMELKGWNDLGALNTALTRAGCPTGDTAQILDNWRLYLERASQEIKEPPGPIGAAGVPASEMSDELVEKELQRMQLEQLRQERMSALRQSIKGGGKDEAMEKLAAEFKQLREDLAKKEAEERHAKEIADLRREFAGRSPTQGNVVTRRIAAVDPGTGRAVTDEDGRPVYNEITEPWSPQAAPEKESDLLKAVTKLVEAQSKPDDTRYASVEAELKALRQAQEDKKLQEVVTSATGPLYQFIEKQRTEQAVAEVFAAKLREMGIGTAPTPQAAAAQENAKVIEGGFNTLAKGMEQLGTRMETRTDEVKALLGPLAQGLGRAVERELAGEAVVREPSEADLRAAERAAEGPTDLPPPLSEAEGPPPTRPAEGAEARKHREL